jgi:hypothetical protein
MDNTTAIPLDIQAMLQRRMHYAYKLDIHLNRINATNISECLDCVFSAVKMEFPDPTYRAYIYGLYAACRTILLS